MRNTLQKLPGEQDALPSPPFAADTIKKLRPPRDAEHTSKVAGGTGRSPQPTRLHPSKARPGPISLLPHPVNFMGKRKAVDLPAPPKGTKEAKKRPGNNVNQSSLSGHNALDAIDLLFEEVESILDFLNLSVTITQDSLINKVTHWLRTRQNCLSIIRSDILAADRRSVPDSNLDKITIYLASKFLVTQLMDFNLRTRLYEEKKGGARLMIDPSNSPTLINFDTPRNTRRDGSSCTSQLIPV
ncbi:hypothetical protein NDU88_000688 [Pleurodeles waltl]|uniref:Uncharacterized protein n=1 Tax=Pleurodeles waltl TaxID=8319 RepID=A0AAV7UUS2_PLEWA|nr:hypothetical protein NDU88_000688 [Pleurodeles waltl]